MRCNFFFFFCGTENGEGVRKKNYLLNKDDDRLCIPYFYPTCLLNLLGQLLLLLLLYKYYINFFNCLVTNIMNMVELNL